MYLMTIGGRLKPE